MPESRPPFRFPTAIEIQERAKEAGLSIPALCARAGVPPSTFYRWLNRESATVHMDVAQRLVDAIPPKA